MHAFSMNNSQLWANSSYFEASVVYFVVILERLCDSYENTLKYLKIARIFRPAQSFQRIGFYDIGFKRL